MTRIYWTKEQKADFWAAFVRHRDEGCNIREAWSRARMDFQAEKKPAPGLQTFSNWYRKAMKEQQETANRPTCPTSPTGPTDAEPIGPGEPEPEGPEGQPGETPELDDYTRRLEMMVRLYRTRSEAAVDAVCDRLLPDLLEEE